MSYHARDGLNANSAVVVTVSPNPDSNNGYDPLYGMEFQRRLEEAAYRVGGGKKGPSLKGVVFFRDCLRDFKAVDCGGRDSAGVTGALAAGIEPLHRALERGVSQRDFSADVRPVDQDYHCKYCGRDSCCHYLSFLIESVLSVVRYFGNSV